MLQREARAKNAVNSAFQRYTQLRSQAYKQKRESGEDAGSFFTPAEIQALDGCKKRALFQGLTGGVLLGGASALTLLGLGKRFALKRMRNGAILASSALGFVWGGVSNSDQCLFDVLSIPERHSPLAEYARKALEAEAPDSDLWRQVQANLKNSVWLRKQEASGGASKGSLGDSGDAWKRDDAATQSMTTSLSNEKLNEKENSITKEQILETAPDRWHESSYDDYDSGSHDETDTKHTANMFGFISSELNGESAKYQHMDADTARGTDSYSGGVSYEDRYRDWDEGNVRSESRRDGEGMQTGSRGSDNGRNGPQLRVDQSYDLMMEGHYEYDGKEQYQREAKPRPTTWDEIRRRRQQHRNSS